jgi:hypothetical protein
MTLSYHEPRKSQQKPWRKRLILFGGLVVLVFSVGLVVGYLRNEQPPKPVPVSEEVSLQPTREVLLYFASLDGVPILPARVELRGVTIADSLVNIDFSRELIAAHPGGTQSELLTIYALVDTLAVNFPHLRQLQVLVEGSVVATLKGHVDLRQPINPDFSLVEEGLAPTGKMTNLPAGSDE